MLWVRCAFGNVCKSVSKTRDLRAAISNLINIFFPQKADQTLLSKHFKYVSCLLPYLLFDFLLLSKHYNQRITSELQLTKYPTKRAKCIFSSIVLLSDFVVFECGALLCIMSSLCLILSRSHLHPFKPPPRFPGKQMS